LIPRRLVHSASCVLLAALMASSATAQTPPSGAMPMANEIETTTPSVPPPPRTRPIVFSPDPADATLEFRGIGLVDGIWRDGWIPVCVGPCAGQVPVAERYRVGGPGVNHSRLFQIGPGVTPLHLEAKAGSAFGYYMGTAATIVGGVALPFGLVAGALADLCIGDGGATCGDNSTQKVAGFVTAGLGAAALVTGILLLVRNRTVVSGDEP
jgi:hypothetical protein